MLLSWLSSAVEVGDRGVKGGATGAPVLRREPQGGQGGQGGPGGPQPAGQALQGEGQAGGKQAPEGGNI